MEKEVDRTIANEHVFPFWDCYMLKIFMYWGYLLYNEKSDACIDYNAISLDIQHSRSCSMTYIKFKNRF